jgi:hypothetical protein
MGLYLPMQMPAARALLASSSSGSPWRSVVASKQEHLFNLHHACIIVSYFHLLLANASAIFHN